LCPKAESADQNEFKEVEAADLVKFGLIPEFVGRLPVIATLNDLNIDAMIQILTAPKNALVKQFKKLFELESVKLTFTDEALKSIADKAIKRKTGARALRSILEKILLDSMFDIPSLHSVEEVVVNEDAVDKDSEPLLIYSKSSEEPASAS
jgi:ATP-dependent Clp protease ATP-binding subunit ClpX